MTDKKSFTVEQQLFRSLIRDKDIMPKALANYMFREVIEEVHAKYNISQEDMKDMCKGNRAIIVIIWYNLEYTSSKRLKAKQRHQ